jgi:electron transport complex protein RnfE
MSKNKLGKVFTNGLFAENPTFRLVLGTCPTIAVTTNAINGVGMGVAATFVLIGSNVVISMLRNFIPNKVRIPAFVVVICTFVTMIQLLMHAFVPALYDSLGIFLPLIGVNCMILARAEAFACKNNVARSAMDGLGMGLGFTMSMLLIGAIREVIGGGTIFNYPVFGAGFQPMLLLILAPGGFIVYGLSLGIINGLTEKFSSKKKEA